MKTVTNKKNKKSQTKYKTIPKNTNTEKNIKNIRKKSKNKTNILTINRESNKHETYLQKNIKYLKNILFKSDNIVSDLDIFFTNIENKEIYNYYKNIFKPFSKNKMGKSGAILGYLDNNKIIKFNEISKKQNSINYKNCVYLKYNFNELLLNLILSNLKHFIKKKSELKKLSSIEPYILKIENGGIKNQNTFIIMNKIGILHNDKFYTNLNEIFINNYIPKLLDCIKENDTKTLDEFNKFLSEILTNYFRVLKFLNTNIGFIHTDSKTLNIFVNKNDKFTIKYKKLKNKGFIVNYIPLVSDLDKSTLNLKIKNETSKTKKNNNNLRNLQSSKAKSKKKSNNKIPNDTPLIILPYDDSPFKTNTSKMFGFDFIYHTRYLCDSDRKNICRIFKSYHYDRLTVIFELYIIIYKFLEIPSGKKNCYSLFHVFNRNVSKFLDINEKQTELIYKTIKNSILIKNAESLSLGFHINKVIGNYCRNIK